MFYDFNWITWLIINSAVGILFLGMFITFGFAVAQQLNDMKLLALQQQVKLTEAYQRFVLLMERISPNNLVMRKHNPGMPAMAQQQTFLEEIRNEFDHNIAQQIFISPECWKSLKDAKEETIKIFNIAASNLPPTATGMDYAQKIFEVTSEVGKLPTEIAVENLKKEMQRLF